MDLTLDPALTRSTSGNAKSGSGELRRDSRSAVTNGNRLFVVPPGDTAWSRRFRDVFNQIIADLSGPDGLSEGQRQLARRCATIAIACERMEGQTAAGDDIRTFTAC